MPSGPTCFMVPSAISTHASQLKHCDMNRGNEGESTYIDEGEGTPGSSTQDTPINSTSILWCVHEGDHVWSSPLGPLFRAKWPGWSTLP